MKLSLDKAAGTDLGALSDEQLRELLGQVSGLLAEDRQANAILYYKPASARARAVHLSSARKIGISGGNGSSKTETMMAEIAAMATGRLPKCEGDPELRAALRAKFRNRPTANRLVLESLTTTLHQVLLPKYRWFHWTGEGMPGTDKGHYGWIPKDCLIEGNWSKSWSEKLRVLTVHCFDPDDPMRKLGESTIQFMSHDQDPTDFASGDYHIVGLDEPPREAIFVENEARTMRVSGRIMLAMTWPDNPEIPIDWLFDRMYDRARPGTDTEWHELWTTENKHLNQESIARQMRDWTELERQVRIYGKPIRFSNLVHPDFTDQERYWCYQCGAMTVPLHEAAGVVVCGKCGGQDVGTFCHVWPFEYQPVWPVVCLLDPHPRKPHMLTWVAVDPADDWWVIAEREEENHSAEGVHKAVARIESDLRMSVRLRLMDPNMGRTTVNAAHTETEAAKDWQQEFAGGGLNFSLADDNSAGRERVNEMLRPSRHRRGPRLHIHPRCGTMISQMKRYSWDEHKRSLEKDQKQTPRQRYDDFPTLLKYLANAMPSFSGLRDVGMIVHRMPVRKAHKATFRQARY